MEINETNEKIPSRHTRWLILFGSLVCCLSIILFPLLTIGAMTDSGLGGTTGNLLMSSNSNSTDQVASKISELYQKMAELEEQKNSLNSKIETAKSNLSTTLEAKTLLDEQVAATEAQIAALNEILAEYDLMIAEKQEQIDRHTAAYQQKYAIFLERLRQSYEEGTPSVLEIFFYSDSFIDMLTSIERMNDILAYDQELMDELEKETAELKVEQSQLITIQNEKKTAENELVEKKATLDQQIADSLAYIQTLEQDCESLTALLAQVEADEQETNRAIEEAFEQFNKLTGSEITNDPALTMAYKVENVLPSIREAMENGTLQKGGEYYEGAPEYILPVSLPALDAGMISSRFGWRTYTDNDGNVIHSDHKGVDFAVAYNSPIYAAKSGTVLSVGTSSGYGKMVVIVHDNGTQTRYAHCTSISVQVGEYVLQGEEIARVGSTGNATGNCCHFEIRFRENDVWTPYDPLKYLDAED
ncbi:MAG: murein hydrolase activator EnvC family protein [Eubacteriales bacterium]